MSPAAEEAMHLFPVYTHNKEEQTSKLVATEASPSSSTGDTMLKSVLSLGCQLYPQQVPSRCGEKHPKAVKCLGLYRGPQDSFLL